MKTRGYAVTTAKAPLGNFEFERRALRPRDVALDIYYSGICHSDIHQAREEWGPAIFPMVPGHEIVGKVIVELLSTLPLRIGKQDLVKKLELWDSVV